MGGMGSKQRSLGTATLSVLVETDALGISSIGSVGQRYWLKKAVLPEQ